MLLIIFNGIFHQIGKYLGDFHIIQLRRYRPDAFKNHFHIPEPGNGAQTLEYGLDQLVYVHRGNVHLGGGLVHLHKRKQIVDDLILPLDFIRNVLHEFLVKRKRGILLLHEGIREHLHGGQRRLQLVGYIGNKFLTGIVNYLHLGQQLVKGIDDMLCFDIIRHGYRFIGKTVLYLRYSLGNPVEGLHQDGGKPYRNPENTDNHHDFYDHRLAVQNLHRCGYAVRGYTGKHDALHLACIVLFHRIGGGRLALAGAGFLDGYGHFDIAVFLIVFCAALPLEAEDDLFRNHGLAFTDTICIFYNPEIVIDNDNASVIQIGHLLQLRIDSF